jgi:thiosulfate reductase cytochrome b subunit
VGYTVVSGEWRHLVPDRNSFREAVQVTLYDLGLRKSQPPFIKYNGAQKIAYSTIILMGVGSILTGYAIYKPTQFSWLTRLLGGYEAARLEHFVLTVGFVLFFFVHVAQVIRAGWQNFQSMITGVEVIKPHSPNQPTPQGSDNVRPAGPSEPTPSPMTPPTRPALS